MSVTRRDWVTTYEGRDYKFCSEVCQTLFLKDSAGYLNDDPENKHFDLIIIGGGPAGLTAAVYASLQHLSTLLLAKQLGGQAIDTSRIKNYLGYDLISGSELLGKFEEQLLAQKYIEHRLDEVLHVKISDEGFSLQTHNGSRYESPAVIVTTGMHRRRLDVPGEQRLQRHGVSYRLIHELERYAGQPVAVIGGGNSGIAAAIELSRIGCRVMLISSGPLSGDPEDIAEIEATENVTILTNHETISIEGDERVSGLCIQPRGGGAVQLLEVTAVFIEIGYLPNTDCVAHLLNRNRHGEIEIGVGCSTNVPGMFAAGDVTNGFGKRIIIAAGEGARAALAAGHYLRMHEAIATQHAGGR